LAAGECPHPCPPPEGEGENVCPPAQGEGASACPPAQGEGEIHRPYVHASARSGELVHRGPRALAAWLRCGGEEPLEPALPIIDAHHHLWERGEDVYGIDSFAEEIRASGHAVRASVFVECRWRYEEARDASFAPVGETRHVAALAAARATQAGLCAGIVGFADLTLGDSVQAVLEAHLAAGRGRFRGVRQRAVWDAHVRPDTPGLRPALLGEPAFRRGFAVLQRLGLAFDAWQYYHQLEEVAALARAFPQVPIVVDHTGGPIGVGPHARDPAGMRARWRAGLSGLARCDNVFMKLGGLGMLHCGFDFHDADAPPSSRALADAWRPFLEPCIDALGPQRCMFESNFPVDRQSAGYGVLWNAFKRVAAGCSPEEKHALFFGTACRAYRLDAPAPA
jgi:L-fuconolactonase